MELSDLLDSDALAYCNSQTANSTLDTDGVSYDHSLDKLLLAAYEGLCEPPRTTPAAQQERVDLDTADHNPNACGPLAPPTTTRPSPTPTADQPHPSGPPAASRFAGPVTDAEVLDRRESAIPAKTAQDTKYCTKVWQQWSDYRNLTQNSGIPQLSVISRPQFKHWLVRFVLEARKLDGSEYPPQTLHHLCSGLVRYLRLYGHPDLDIFKDNDFVEFRATLDAEMKRLQGKGLGSWKRQAEPLTEEEEEALWSKGVLGDHSPETLLNTIIFMNGLYFALRSGKEHRDLRFNESQISLVQHDGERSFLEYVEDVSKNRPGGLKGRRIGQKVVRHYENISDSSRCFIRLFTLYRRHCPPDPKQNAFYLKPLKRPTGNIWYSREPLGHNTLQQAVSTICKAAGIPGFRTNHSLRATSATRLYAAGADEQLIMERTGHRSIDGVRSYKRTSALQQQVVSDILSRTSTPAIQPTSDLPVPTSVPIVTGTQTQPPVSTTAVPTPVHTTDTNITNSFSTMSMPGTFNFHSCNSVVININK